MWHPFIILSSSVGFAEKGCRDMAHPIPNLAKKICDGAQSIGALSKRNWDLRWIYATMSRKLFYPRRQISWIQVWFLPQSYDRKIKKRREEKISRCSGLRGQHVLKELREAGRYNAQSGRAFSFLYHFCACSSSPEAASRDHLGSYNGSILFNPLVGIGHYTSSVGLPTTDFPSSANLFFSGATYRGTNHDGSSWMFPWYFF